VTTVNTEQLASMLNTQKPLVIDTMDASWYRSIPGAVGLDISRNTHGTFTDAVQKRLKCPSGDSASHLSRLSAVDESA
jgi:hypothetical protein